MLSPRWIGFRKVRRPHALIRLTRRTPQFEYLEARRVLATVTLNTDTGIAGELRTEMAGAVPGETIDFNLSAGNETIVLDMALGELVVDKALDIDGDNAAGSGLDITISGGGNVRVMNVNDGVANTYAAVNLSNLTVTGGMADDGAGIRNSEVLTLTNATVSGNTATAGSGGGIYSVGLGSALNLQSSTVDSNYATSVGYMAGGGIAATLGSLTISDSTISNNTATGIPGTFFTGGGISVTSTGPDAQYAPLDVTVTGSTISGNVVMGEQDPVYPYNGVNPWGGGIYAGGYGQVTVNASVISGNAAMGSGANQGSGGGLLFYSGFYTLYVDVDDTEVTSNTSTNRGGGMTLNVNYYSTGNVDADLSGMTIANNESVFYGGGVYQYGADRRVSTRITDSTISGNTSGATGGLTSWNAYLLLESSSVTGNAAINEGGFQYGGGISNYGLYLNYYPADLPPIMVIVNSTISGNSTSGRGGGIYSLNGYLDVIQSTISDNTAGTEGGGVFLYTNGAYQGVNFEPRTSIDTSTITNNSSVGEFSFGGGGIYNSYYHNLFSMSNTIVSGNATSSVGPDVYDYSTTGAVAANTTFSLIGDNAESGFAEANPGPDGNGNIVGGAVSGVADAMLGPLADNGGQTLTHLPMEGSPAIDAADPAVIGGTDQTGGPRVNNGRMDMGSVETGGSPNGDFNGDGFWDCDDINALTTEVASMTNNLAFDLTGDGLVNGDDIDTWLVEGGAMNPGATGGNPFLPGDANLDGVVDGLDFIEWNMSKFTSNSNWCNGDFNADGVVDGLDFIVWNTFKFMSSSPIANRAPGGIVQVQQPTNGADADRHSRQKLETESAQRTFAKPAFSHVPTVQNAGQNAGHGLQTYVRAGSTDLAEQASDKERTSAVDELFRQLVKNTERAT